MPHVSVERVILFTAEEQITFNNVTIIGHLQQANWHTLQYS